MNKKFWIFFSLICIVIFAVIFFFHGFFLIFFIGNPEHIINYLTNASELNLDIDKENKYNIPYKTETYEKFEIEEIPLDRFKFKNELLSFFYKKNKNTSYPIIKINSNDEKHKENFDYLNKDIDFRFNHENFICELKILYLDDEYLSLSISCNKTTDYYVTYNFKTKKFVILRDFLIIGQNWIEDMKQVFEKSDCFINAKEIKSGKDDDDEIFEMFYDSLKKIYKPFNEEQINLMKDNFYPYYKDNESFLYNKFYIKNVEGEITLFIVFNFDDKYGEKYKNLELIYEVPKKYFVNPNKILEITKEPILFSDNFKIDFPFVYSKTNCFLNDSFIFSNNFIKDNLYSQYTKNINNDNFKYFSILINSKIIINNIYNNQKYLSFYYTYDIQDGDFYFYEIIKTSPYFVYDTRTGERLSIGDFLDENKHEEIKKYFIDYITYENNNDFMEIYEEIKNLNFYMCYDFYLENEKSDISGNTYNLYFMNKKHKIHIPKEFIKEKERFTSIKSFDLSYISPNYNIYKKINYELFDEKFFEGNKIASIIKEFNRKIKKEVSIISLEYDEPLTKDYFSYDEFICKVSINFNKNFFVIKKIQNINHNNTLYYHNFTHTFSEIYNNEGERLFLSDFIFDEKKIRNFAIDWVEKNIKDYDYPLKQNMINLFLDKKSIIDFDIFFNNLVLIYNEKDYNTIKIKIPEELLSLSLTK